MAELTNMESKIGEVTGLAMAAKSATSTVIKLAKESDDDELVGMLTRMKEEAAETEERCSAVAGSFDGKKTAILEEARETKEKGAKMMAIYLDESSDVLDGFEFLTMAEAGEVGHWEVLKEMASSAGVSDVVELTKWALPIQQRHFADAKTTSVKLASDEDPNGESS